MMVCQTGLGSVFLTSFLRHRGRNDNDLRLIEISDFDNLPNDMQNLHCENKGCQEDLHDIFLAIDGGHGELAGTFGGDNQFIESARAATPYNRPQRHESTGRRRNRRKTEH